MFEGNTYQLTEDKFDYFRKVFHDLGVSITVEEVSKNPHIDLPACRDSDTKRAEEVGGKPREFTLDSYTHLRVTLKRGDLVREISVSIQNECYDDDGKLIVNPDLRFMSKLSPRIVGLYLITSGLFWSMLCQGPREAFQHMVDGNLYLWAEAYNISDRLDEGQFERSFEYLKNIVKSFIDVLGEDVVIDLVDSFFVCGVCGEGRPNE
jgi:hypothetical protein